MKYTKENELHVNKKPHPCGDCIGYGDEECMKNMKECKYSDKEYLKNWNGD